MSLFTIDGVKVLPIVYQSQDISFSEWVTLVTLGLAPLIGHIIAGTPQPSYLCRRRPKWHERICLYNPTSILWRYAAITDRRIRARSWNTIDMAATNALFWTKQGWDGSEAMVELSIPYCLHPPTKPRIEMFSQDVVKTIIVTVQGIQAIILLTTVFNYNGDAISPFVIWMAVDIIFFPLAFIGLLRLSCSFWLSDDFLFSIPYVFDLGPGSQATWFETRFSVDSLLERPVFPTSTRFRETSFWPSRLFRLVFVLPIFGMWTMTVLYLFTGANLTATTFLVILVYNLFLGTTIPICSYYFVYGYTKTTITPCLSSFWYRFYTGVLFCLTIVLFIVACIETRKTPCGKYTSGTGFLGDHNACWTTNAHVLPVDSDQNWFGLASRFLFYSNNGPILKAGEYWLYNFTGTCLGLGNYHSAQLGLIQDFVEVNY